MESVLLILCIVFFVVLTYGLIQGTNLHNNHLYTCRTLYIPEDIDLETASKTVKDKNVQQLKKRARELGATKKMVDSMEQIDLKVFIVEHSISDEHIYFKKLEDMDIISTEKDRTRRRMIAEVSAMPSSERQGIANDLQIESD